MIITVVILNISCFVMVGQLLLNYSIGLIDRVAVNYKFIVQMFIVNRHIIWGYSKMFYTNND